VQDVAQAIVQSLNQRHSIGQVYELVGPQVFTLQQLVEQAGAWSGHVRWVFGLPHPVAYVQALLMELMPGPPLMSRDNLASMQSDNVASGSLPGLRELGVAHATSLAAIFPAP
jgi:NADH dehydrogenase